MFTDFQLNDIISAMYNDLGEEKRQEINEYFLIENDLTTACKKLILAIHSKNIINIIANSKLLLEHGSTTQKYIAKHFLDKYSIKTDTDSEITLPLINGQYKVQSSVRVPFEGGIRRIMQIAHEWAKQDDTSEFGRSDILEMSIIALLEDSVGPGSAKQRFTSLMNTLQGMFPNPRPFRSNKLPEEYIIDAIKELKEKSKQS
jgi:hypothetical protein